MNPPRDLVGYGQPCLVEIVPEGRQHGASNEQVHECKSLFVAAGAEWNPRPPT
ncbi:MAG TPA: hypothetical protein VGR14_07425 [Verrucomicrobiae bacterium]|jgi:hypothetical protein|nr:hypothetical protein [Verrucomicrobiae bacterium]